MVAFLHPCFHAENSTRRLAVAYCTSSSDDYRCDVLAAALVNGYQIVVGWRRIKGDVPKTEHLDVEGMETEYEEACRRQAAFIRNAEYELIDLPYAGDTFRFNEFEDFAEKMNELYDLGYCIWLIPFAQVNTTFCFGGSASQLMEYPSRLLDQRSLDR